jgi:acyl-coenzyme A synthetase/AMP-(fatty) acid ligase
MIAGAAWYPRDVEEALCRVAGVRQAALVGLPDATLGSRPAAFVLLADGAQLDPATLKEAIRNEIGYDLGPLTIRIVDSLPMTPTGKIAKSTLAAQAAAAAAAAAAEA